MFVFIILVYRSNVLQTERDFKNKYNELNILSWIEILHTKIL